MVVLSDILRRTKTGFFLILVVILVLWLDSILLPLLLLIFITFAANEYFRFWHRKDIYPHTLAVLFPGYTIPLLFFFEVPFLFPGFLLLFFVFFLSVIRFPNPRHIPNFLNEAAATVLGIVYISLLPSTIIPLRKMGFTIALVPLILTWLFDTFAYLIGSAIGKHKLAEKISPKKTLEGTFISFFLTFPFTILLSNLWVRSLDLLDAIIITIGIGTLGTVGDLFESAMKREVDLKDASKVFPGHGGFLDRLDSLIFNIPFFYLYLIKYG